MDITGFGPATLKTLHETLRISNREDLIEALQKRKTGRNKKLWREEDREYETLHEIV